MVESLRLHQGRPRSVALLLGCQLLPNLHRERGCSIRYPHALEQRRLLVGYQCRTIQFRAIAHGKGLEMVEIILVESIFNCGVADAYRGDPCSKHRILVASGPRERPGMSLTSLTF